MSRFLMMNIRYSSSFLFKVKVSKKNYVIANLGSRVNDYFRNDDFTLSFSPDFKFKICQSSIDLNESEFKLNLKFGEKLIVRS
jgi:hypothetical protein